MTQTPSGAGKLLSDFMAGDRILYYLQEEAAVIAAFSVIWQYQNRES